MMDAMISRCVDELNQFDEEVKKKRLEKGGPEYAHLTCTCMFIVTITGSYHPFL